MRLIPHTFTAVLFLIFCQISVPASGQLGISFDIKKPKEFDDRVLRSERSDQKKFTLPRRAIQNAVTHYNYVFNANNKLNEILNKAKAAFRDDYSQLLPFYNYTLEATAADSIQLDSITYKASTGIALHDLRNDWVDNLYLLWGASYYLQQQYDSAYLMFQFINYAFAPKEKDGYYKAIGSNRDGNSALSIATKEKTSLTRKLFTEPPSRNDAFIWQIRNFLAQDQYPEAASLIVTLRNDPNFPKRLANDLHEVQAYWFYKQNMWDSAVNHLSQALDNATNKQEKARWEYLAAQLYEKTGEYKEAEKYYAKVIGHTTDPVMAVYARLFSIRVNKDGGDNYIEKNIAELVKMAHRDRYQGYEDIIYYMAAQMELERNNTEGALALLNRSTRFSVDNKIQHNRSFLQLAELSFARHQYRESHNYYDSLYMDEPSLENKEEITKRKDLLARMVVQLNIEARQDSLQRIAALTEDERKDYVKKLVKQMRREQGLKDEAAMPTAGTSGSQLPPISNNLPLFPSPGGGNKGDWYFYNSSSRTKGQTDFKARWGNRPNQDNWRRFAAIQAGFQNMSQMTQYSQGSIQSGNKQDGSDNEITYEKLYKNLPLSIDQLNLSNDSLMNAMYALGIAYIQEIEDCSIGTTTLEELRNRFPRFKKMDELLFNLYYCYNKNGEKAKADAIKKLMTESYSASDFTTIINTGKDPKVVTPTSEGTALYEHIYDLFLEGSFTEAVKEKQKADSIYKSNYWTPQLRYIEAVYYIRQREDSTAGSILNDMSSRYANTPMGTRAAKMLEVLGRRKQIEEELQNLQITRYGDSTNTKPVQSNPVTIAPPQSVKKDTVAQKPVVTAPVAVHQPKPVVKDTVATKTIPPPVASPYTFDTKAAQYVVVMMNKVDPVFMTEAKNAFFRYNRETFYNKQMTVDLVDFDPEDRMLLISPFANVDEAMAYLDKTKPRTASDIIPWMKGGKYSFLIVSEKNLNILKTQKDIEAYRQFLNQNLPGKF